MRLLVLGGTVFLGRHIVVAAQRRGHTLTLFNRGRSAPEAFADLEQIHGDREHELELLDGRSWDAVIDTSGYLPGVVSASAERLAGAIEHYTFVSSISAYGSFPEPGLDEDHPVAQVPEPESDSDSDSEDVGRYYGELKAACEQSLANILQDRALIVRPGLIVGPQDPTERFTYWVRRLAEGGRVLAPSATQQPVQLIDVRDLADWIVQLSEQRTPGVFNATGPAEPLTLGETLRRINAATGGDAQLVWAAEERLAEAGVEPWQDLPLWLDLARDPDYRGFMAIDVRRALAAGLTLRPLEETVAATLTWVRNRDGLSGKAFGVPLTPAGLTPEREAELLTRPGLAQ